MIGVLTGREGTQGQRPPGRTPCDNRGRGWSEASVSQGSPRTAGSPCRPRGKHGEGPPEGAWQRPRPSPLTLRCQTSGLQNYAVVNFCYRKPSPPPNLSSSVRAALEMGAAEGEKRKDRQTCLHVLYEAQVFEPLFSFEGEGGLSCHLWI